MTASPPRPEKANLSPARKQNRRGSTVNHGWVRDSSFHARHHRHSHIQQCHVWKVLAVSANPRHFAAVAATTQLTNQHKQFEGRCLAPHMWPVRVVSRESRV